MKKTLILTCTVLFSKTFGIINIRKEGNHLELSTLYGDLTITEPIILEIIQHPVFERLKNIRQYGVTHYAQQEYEYTRYQHSLGVFYLTKKFGAPLEEQVAALLHDISHTVFSHVGDIFFNSNYQTGKTSYQDDIHQWYIEKSGIIEVLKKYGYERVCCLENKNLQPCFDQILPNLCADRIEYNLAGGFIDNLITKEEIFNIINDLYFVNKKWFFKNIITARKFGLLSIKLSELRWGATWDNYVSFNASQAMKQACSLKIIDYNDIHFSTDENVWQKLITSKDEQIIRSINRIKNYKNSFVICSEELSDIHLIGKFSGTDPLVKVEQSIVPLSSMDDAYKKEFDRVKKIISHGSYIKFVD